MLIAWAVTRSTGWLTRWGEKMANTSLVDFITTLDGILSFNNGTGSVNLYMAHGGTNFGYTAGAPRPRCHAAAQGLARHLLCRGAWI